MNNLQYKTGVQTVTKYASQNYLVKFQWEQLNLEIERGLFH